MKNQQTQELTPEQIMAMKRSIILGGTLQENFPEIADDYRRGVTQLEIIKKYDICKKYGVTETVAITSVSKALNGHKGVFEIYSYDGLVEESELEVLSKRHNIEAGRKTHKLKVGIHGRSPEQHSQDGEKSYKLKVGIHGRSPEQMSKDGKKAGKKSALSRGQTPWKDEAVFTENEKQYHINLEREIHIL